MDRGPPQKTLTFRATNNLREKKSAATREEGRKRRETARDGEKFSLNSFFLSFFLYYYYYSPPPPLPISPYLSISAIDRVVYGGFSSQSFYCGRAPEDSISFFRPRGRNPGRNRTEGERQSESFHNNAFTTDTSSRRRQKPKNLRKWTVFAIPRNGRGMGRKKLQSFDPLDPAFHYLRVSQCVLLEFYYVYNGDRENTIDQKDKKDFRAEVFANKDSSRADPFITNRSSSAWRNERENTKRLNNWTTKYRVRNGSILYFRILIL